MAAHRPARSWQGPSRTPAGRLIGETTIGKGTVQQWQESTGEGAFRLTIARWLTPNKRWIHDVGMEPDVPVVIPDDVAPDEDPVLDRALEILDEAEEADWAGRSAACDRASPMLAVADGIE